MPPEHDIEVHSGERLEFLYNRFLNETMGLLRNIG